EGIHIGVMAGTLNLLQRSYLGEMTRDAVLSFAPKAVNQLRGLSLPMRFRGLPLQIALERNRLQVTARVDSLNVSRSVKVGVGDQVQELRSGEAHNFDL